MLYNDQKSDTLFLRIKFAKKIKKYMPGRKFLKTIFILLILEYLGKAVIYLIMKL